TIAVNSPANAKDDSYATNVNKVLTVTAALGVLANDTDANGHALTATLAQTTSHGTLVLQSNGAFTYTPNNGFQGTDSFTYKASDGTYQSGVATVTIVVSNPITSVQDNYTVEGGTSLSVNASQGVLANDSDSSGGTLTATLGSSPAHGTLTLNSDG